MKKLDDWPRRLDVYLKAAQGRLFSWDKFNCCTFAAGAVQAQTGVDVVSGFGVQISDKWSALLTAKELAGGVRELAEKVLGEKSRIPPLLAGRGDIVCLETPDGDALGVVDFNGETAWFVHPDRGPGLVALADCVCAWRIE